jgi:hypothetical protein
MMNDIIWTKDLWDKRRKMELMKDIRTMANVPQLVGDGVVFLLLKGGALGSALRLKWGIP